MALIQERRLNGIAQILVQAELLEREKALYYQQTAVTEKLSFLQYLANTKVVDSKAVALAVAQNFGLPVLDLSAIEIELLPTTILNEKLIRRYGLIPLYNRGKQLYVAIDDPSQQLSLKEIQFHTGLHISPVVVETNKLFELIDHLLHEKESQGLADYFDESGEIESLEFSTTEEEDKDADIASLSNEDAPVVKFVNRILIEAIKKGASDIHFEPYEREYRIRYRMDGILNEVASPPVSLSTRISARIKVMSDLDISERRVPQDGRFKMKLSRTRAIDFRVSTCPTIGGEKVVMRILDPGSTKLGIESLGFSQRHRELF